MDEHLRELERDALRTDDPLVLDRLIAEQRRARCGRFADLAAQLEVLGSSSLPWLGPNRCRFRGALLREVGETWLHAVSDVYALLDRVLLEHLPRAFAVPVTFQWAGAPGGGRTMRDERPEPDGDADEATQRAFYLDPEPWQELRLPWRSSDDSSDGATTFAPRHPALRARPDNFTPHHTDRSAGRTVRDRLLKAVRWGINDKVYRVRRGGEAVEVSFSFDPAEQAQIAVLEAEHDARRVAFVDLLLEGVTERARVFTTCHVLEERHVEEIGLSGVHRDEVHVLLDVDHVRVVWTAFDRFYG